ncbi:ABC transporter permease [Biostraticola tofi]|uniref:ABC-type nitrate/sulfonate/bicarbonate transport system permease component n=1 Tax=Biostraticola tofi TaxID=466109 RepID=A0A4V2W5J9_9GAMM|nr:ABC transporter permease [Biostraticola tofi]TCW00096.1 ABC-type nitrate/sulfonate/bicarbonate transport system permease component [Biostraticola tofi]
MLRIFPTLVVFTVLLACWEAYCSLSGVSSLILPAPSGVLSALVINRAEIGSHALATLRVAGLGFGLSIGFAFVTSVALHFLPWAKRGLMPLFVASQTVPLVALAPLMILWFGFGLLPKVLLVVLVTFFPILLSLLSGYRQTPRAYSDLLVSMGAGRWRVFCSATLPSARAALLAGLRISATYSIVATIFAEYAGARLGLGIYILSAKNNFRADLVLAAVVVSAALTLTLLGGLRIIDRLTARGPEAQGDA